MEAALSEAPTRSAATLPPIDRPHRLIGRTLTLRHVELDDAAFIHALRSDARRNRHLSAPAAGVAAQRAWLAEHARRQGDAYFIIESGGVAHGTVRVYDAAMASHGPSFCWGSWALLPSAPATAAMESALMVYAWGLDHLGFEGAHFQVRHDNERVRAFHERFGAVVVRRDETQCHHELPRAAIEAARRRYARFLPDGIGVEPGPQTAAI